MGNHVGLFLPLPDGEAKCYPELEKDTSDPHVTVLYLGDQSSDAEDLIIAATEEALEKFKPFTVSGSGVDYFHPEDEDYDVAFTPVKSARLHKLRQALADACRKHGVKWTDSYPTYQPHVTLQYTDKGEEWDGDTPSWSFEADRICLWGFDKDHDFRLGQRESRSPKSRIQTVCERIVSSRSIHLIQ